MTAVIQQLPELHVGMGWRFEGLTLFPVWARMPVSDVLVVDASEVQIQERPDGPQVSQIMVHNTGKGLALLLEGELIEGGWQNRALNSDLLLEPGASSVVEVTCVEQGRWAGVGGHVRRSRIAPGGVRMGLRRHESERQGEVWRRVSHYEPSMGATRTRSLAEHLDRVSRGRDHRWSKKESARIGDIPGSPMLGQVGVIVALGGRPAWLEIFPTPGILAEFWSALVDAALLDAVSAPDRPCPGQYARDFAVHARAVPLAVSVGSGTGQAFASAPAAVSVRGIASSDGELLHALAVDTHHHLWGAA
jgi:hypothetical protein